MWISKAAWDAMLEGLILERKRNQALEDKCARLTEALIMKEGHVPVRLPNAPMVEVSLPTVSPANVPQPTERTDQWMSREWFGSGGHKIATPPREEKVSAP